MVNRQNKRSHGYVGAPFNFVPFYKKVVSVEKKQMDVRGSLKKEQYTGEISYKLTAQTPICIDDGQGNFFKNEYNEVAIPSSSMRGLIRNNAQILGLSSFDDDIDDYTLMYRDVTGGVDKYFYKEILGAGIVSLDGAKFSVLKNVSAGYISCERGKYYIYKTDVDSLRDSSVNMNYYIISARKILKNLKQYSFFQTNPNCLMYRLDCEFACSVTFIGQDSEGQEMTFSYKTETDFEGLVVGKKFYYRGVPVPNENKIIIEEFSDRQIENGQEGICKKNPIIHYIPKDSKKGENDNYIPFYKKVLYKIINGRFVDSIKEYDTKNTNGYLEGYLMGTGIMNEKKVLYIIPKINEQKDKIEIQEQDIKAYQVDYKKRENTLVSRVNNPDLKKKLSLEIKDFFSLPEEGKRRPIFYIDPGKVYNIKRLYFGYTPRLRLFYSHSVKEGYHQDISAYDYVRSIFGTAESNVKVSGRSEEEKALKARKAYRSKVSFTDAVLKEKPKYAGNYNLILGEPKPSSFYDYIEQQGEVTTYNDYNFSLRGVKQYWLADSLHQLPMPNDVGENKDVRSLFQALKEKSEFIGMVRFQNLSEAELGLLLWSIRLQDNSCMNIGKAKSYGFGVISVSDIKVKVVDLDKAYSLDTPLSLNPFIEKNVDKLIDSYKDEINKKLDGETIDQLEHIQDFCAMKNYKCLPDKDMIRFMSIDNGENDYQNRQNSRVPLATIQQVLSNQQSKPVRIRSRNRSNGNNTAPQEWTFECRESERRERAPLENDHMYVARISKYQGKKVFFQVDKDYYNTSINNIRNIQDLTKETMKELLPVNSMWNIRKHMKGEQVIWEFEAK